MAAILAGYDKIVGIGEKITKIFKVLSFLAVASTSFSASSQMLKAKPTSTKGKLLIAASCGLSAYTVALLGGRKICANDDDISKNNRNYTLFYLGYVLVSLGTMILADKVYKTVGSDEKADASIIKSVRSSAIANFVFALLFFLISEYVVYNPFKAGDMDTYFSSFDWPKKEFMKTYSGI